MTDREPVSVLLPTIRWTVACDQLADQLREGDELFVICDSEADPVADHDPPEGVEILVAGDPEGCSGKANAVACGLDHATNDRFVWTDADFERDADWLDRLVAEGEAHGPASAVPFWYGDGFWALMEPWTAMFSTLLMYLGVGSTANIGWGGGLTFTRDELDCSVAALADELRQVLSDDGLVSQHLGDVHHVRSMVTPVEVPGDLRTTYARVVRFNRLTHVHEGMHGDLVVATGLAVAGGLFPFVVAPAVTLATGVAYAILGLRRPTFLLSFLGLFLVPLAILAGMVVTEFEWAGRRYRLADEYEVTVVGPAS
ncbi:glycosyltransferase [Haloarchaeobius amylolyticus]|uniref:glycosyltransferase n=1 Tax=Haloarchaeobius amylolyticus TaxID=1198296 RepID=UPI00226FCD2C|nr:glycosyltransferase [Haloarchaeobius amylolyticus]